MAEVSPNEEAVFLAALEQRTPEERLAYVNRACAGDSELCNRLLELVKAHDRSKGPLDVPPPGLQSTIVPPQISAVGTQIGPYKVLEQIGEGGFGIVYMADQQAPVRRRVALKVIKPGMDTRQVLSRFKAEQQALALMDHPNIARVLDAGATASGRPYFVMELVRGVPITDYCDQNKLAVHERLELFAQVCHAVQHAHQKGIIHRDIKPSNVLVTVNDSRPLPKVIDFGVAKAINQQLTAETVFTRFAEMIGTPLYMSPEQAEMTSLDIDTRSDVYSLGVLLYELLTGSTPIEKGRLKLAAFDEIRRIIREEEPAKPSTRISTSGETAGAVAAHRQADPQRLSKLVRGDLDWIVMKALEKDRTRRYETANGLAMELERYLADEPVLARPPSTLYRFGKFARRNRVAFGTAIVVLVAILVGTLVSVAEAIRMTRAERLAESRLETETTARQAEAAQRQIADRERAEATRQRDSATRQLYVSRMNLAQRAWEENNVGRVCELLESQTPEHTGGSDLRGWEWNYLWRLSHSELRQLTFANGASPLCIGFGLDGDVFITGLVDGHLKAWSADGKHELWSVQAHTDRVSNLAFRSDGRVFATAGGEGVAKLWETATGRELGSFSYSPEVRQNRGLALSPDGHRLATTADAAICVWDTSSAKAIWTLTGHTNQVDTLAFSPDGNHLYSGSWDGTAAKWDLSTGKRVQTFVRQGVNPTLNAVAIDPDGHKLFAGWRDGGMKSWDVKTGEELKTLGGHKGKVSRLVFSPEGTHLASASDDTTVKLWNVTTGDPIETLRGHASSVADVAFSPRENVIASAAWDGTVRFWDAASRQEPWSKRQRYASFNVAYSGDGRFLATGSGLSVNVRDVSSGRRLWTEDERASVMGNVITFDPENRLVTVGTLSGEIHFRDAREGGLRRTLKAHAGRVTSLAYRSDGRILASAGDDREISLWNLEDGRRTTVFRGHTDYVRFLAFSPDGRFVASAGDEKDRSVRLWDISKNELARTFIGHEGAIDCLVFSRDGQQLFTGSVDETIRIWDVETGQTIRVQRGHAGTVKCLSLSPDGTRLASGGDDSLVRIWDVATGQELLSLKPNGGNVYGVAFSPDGGRLAATSHLGLLTVWDARPLTADVRAELVAADTLDRLLPIAKSEEDLFRLIHERVSNNEPVRRRALAMAAPPFWQLRNKILTAERAFEHNTKAWTLATNSDPRLRDIPQAVKLARQAVALAPQQGTYWNTLGVAEYRAADWKPAIDALKTSMQLRKAGDSFDCFFLAMAEWQLGNKDEARRWYAKATEWMEKNERHDDDLQRFRAEATDLIAAKPAPSADPKEKKEPKK